MFTIITTTDFIITETCKDDNVQILTQEWLISNTTTLTLPVTCTIESEFISCGYLDIVRSNEEHIQIEPARMIVFSDTHAQEEMVKISDDEWIFNTIEAPEETSFSLSDWTPVIGGSGAGVFIIIILFLVAWILYKQSGSQNGSKDAIVVKVNTVVNNAGDTRNQTSNQTNLYPALTPEEFELKEESKQGQHREQHSSEIIAE